MKGCSADDVVQSIKKKVIVRRGRGKRIEDRSFLLPPESQPNDFLFPRQTRGLKGVKGIPNKAISDRAMRKMMQEIRTAAAAEHENPDYYWIRSHSERYSVYNWFSD